MPQDAAERRVRRGAKSCAECRRRKIRCIWSSNEVCDPCLAHDRTCVPQLQRSPAPAGARLSSKARISHIERDMAALVALVKEGRLPSASTSDQFPSFSGGRLDEDLEHEPDAEDMTEPARPSHLRFLFDDIVVGSQRGTGDRERDHRANPYLQNIMRLARTKLQSILPTFDEVVKISPYASDWMTLYYTLFPPAFAFHNEEQLITQYHQMQEAEANPSTIAMYLLSLAITIQQMPQSSLPLRFRRSRDVTSFIETICKTVYETIISGNTIPATPESLETAMLYVRLSFGRDNLKGTWLTLRRVISLAELMGLPQANQELGRTCNIEGSELRRGPEKESLELRAKVWESICATDRNISVMLNLPAGTARYRFPRENSIWREGRVSPQAYAYQLSNVCPAIFEIDESYLSGLSHEETYEKVLRTDRQLRALKASTPKWWWDEMNTDSTALPESLVKFWHNYFMLRVHLRPAMMGSLDEQYQYSRDACLKACQNAVALFTTFRKRIPSGFFICRVVDLQVFAAATFLLLSGSSQLEQRNIDSHIVPMVQAIADCFASLSDAAGADLASEAQAALVSLISLVRGEDNTEWSQPVLKLQIPLLGTISIDRASLYPAVEAAPISWSLELNDASFWMDDNFIMDNIWAPSAT